MRMKHSSLNISEQEGAFIDEVKCSVNRELLSLTGLLAAVGTS